MVYELLWNQQHKHGLNVKSRIPQIKDDDDDDGAEWWEKHKQIKESQPQGIIKKTLLLSLGKIDNNMLLPQ